MNKILIRKANKEDCLSVFEWRRDKITQEMSINKFNSSFESHSSWFLKSLSSNSRDIFIGELNGVKIGVCRFDLDQGREMAEVSLNINPSMRSKGFGKYFLKESIIIYLSNKKIKLNARIKKNNLASKKVFQYAGFIVVREDKEIINLKRFSTDLGFRNVSEIDVEILYKLLEQREYFISHKSMPTFESHKEFVKNNPYEHWMLILDSNKVIGSFYIQDDNSIGINLLIYTNDIVARIIEYIKNNFTPKKQIKSKIPPYFFINIPYSNGTLIEKVSDLDLSPIQVTYKLER